VHLKSESAMDLLGMCHYYEVHTLKRICGEFVIASIAPGTVSRFLVSAAKYHETSIHKECTAYILKQASAVMATNAFVTVRIRFALCWACIHCDRVSGCCNRSDLLYVAVLCRI
jgi:hypothetical protein